MVLTDVMHELEQKGSAQTKKTYMRHGAPEPLYGVRVGDLKPLQRKLKGNHPIALELYATGNSDAMYLAGLIADGSQLTIKQLDQWARQATWYMIADYAVAWVAAEHPRGIEIASKWIQSKKPLIACAGWSTLALCTATIDDKDLPLPDLKGLLSQIADEIHDAPNRVRYSMNNFIICVGTYVLPLADTAVRIAKQVGTVDVDMGETNCKVPTAYDYIMKCRRGAPVAPKRKSVRCS